jgi:hypothetical protein
MPRHSARRAFIAPDTIWQLKTLFGSGTNAHARLGLHELVPCSEMQKGLSGYPIRADHERLVTQRWAEWRRKFLADPDAALVTKERVARQTGEYYDPEARDLVSEKLVGNIQRFTLLPDAGKYL